MKTTDKPIIATTDFGLMVSRKSKCFTDSRLPEFTPLLLDNRLDDLIRLPERFYS